MPASNTELMIVELSVKVDSSIKLVQSIGSVLHGLIMESISPAYAQELHTYSIRPYSQFLYFDKEKQVYLWRVAAFTRESVERLVRVIYELPDSVFLKQKNGYLYVMGRKILEETNYQELVSRFLTESSEYRGVDLRFMSPTTFKVDGRYAIYPEAFRIYRYLLKRWNLFSSCEHMESEDLLQAIESASRVRYYALQTQKFGLEGVYINGFKGKFILDFKYNLIMRKVMALLSYYAQYTGVGIKTALGMGGVFVELEEEKR